MRFLTFRRFAKQPALNLAAALAFLSGASGPCDESLPPYEAPDRVLSAAVRGDYILSSSDNSLRMYVVVKNDFDETLQGRVEFRGWFELLPARRPEYARRYDVHPSLLSYARSYNRTTGILTLDPGDSLVFRIPWDFIDSQGRDLRSEFFQFVNDPGCSLRCFALPEDIVMTAEVGVFAERAPITASTVFPLCFVSRYVSPKSCVSIQTSPPCVQRPSPGTGLCRPEGFSPID